MDKSVTGSPRLHRYKAASRFQQPLLDDVGVGSQHLNSVSLGNPYTLARLSAYASPSLNAGDDAGMLPVDGGPQQQSKCSAYLRR